MSTKLFAKTLAAAGVIHNREVSEFLIDVYLEALKGYDISDCTQALNRLIKTSKFMPKPADILEALEGDTHAQALTAWPEVERLARNSSEAESNDPITQSVVLEMGGWSRFGRAQYSEYPFLQREFIDRYKTYKTSPALLEKATQAQIGTRTNKTLKLADIGNE
jgi:hypothetical protein